MQTEALTLQGASEGFHVLLDDGYRPPIVAQDIVEPAEVELCLYLQVEISKSLADDESPLPNLKGAVKVLSHIEVVGHEGEDPTQPTLIVKGHREAFSFAEVVDDPLLLSKW